MNHPPKNIAFALSGLAGNNAHGAGFLQAALAVGVIPRVISCTSGQIYWVFNYLKALNDPAEPPAGRAADTASSLRSILKEDIDSVPEGPMGAISQLLWGRPGKIEPDYPQFFNDVAMNSWQLVLRNLTRPASFTTLSDFYHLIPSKWLTPCFPDSFYHAVSRCFNDEGRVGILFNSYNPGKGCETVYVNDTARQALNLHDRTGSRNVLYRAITPSAVRDALRLYDYGFAEDLGPNIDGEYFRPVILRELVAMDRVFVVRPVNTRWIGELPKTRPELEDMKTEIGINAIYAAEKAGIDLINTLIEKGHFREGHPYHPVMIDEVEIEIQQGFDDYAREDMGVFDAALSRSRRLLGRDRR
ncbi:hypothetical protein JCM14469_27750 [Desulfatiferula olefinivorans]